jgi:hypothetical protein
MNFTPLTRKPEIRAAYAQLVKENELWRGALCSRDTVLC